MSSPSPARGNPLAIVLDDPAGPQPPGVWSDAFNAAGWTGEVHAATPAGWFGEAPIVGGNYDMADPIFHLIRSGLDAEKPLVASVVVGIGTAGWSATLWALAGRAQGLVLIDGSGGPWLSHQERNARALTNIRAQRDVALKLAPPVDQIDGGSRGVVDSTDVIDFHPTDPRRRIAPLPHGNRILGVEAAESLRTAGVVTAIFERPSGAGASDANAEMAARLGGSVLRTENRPEPLAVLISEWAVAQELS